MQRLRFSRYFKAIFVILDVIIIASLFSWFFILGSPILYFDKNIWQQNTLSITLLSLFWILLSARTKIYSIPRNLTYTLYLEHFFSHMLIFLFGIILLGKVSNNAFLKTEKSWLALSLFSVFIAVKSFIFFLLKYLRSIGINYRNVMFLGNSSSVEILRNIVVQRKDYGYKIHEFPNPKIEITELIDFWKTNGIHSIFLPSESSEISRELQEIIFREAENHKIRVLLLPTISKNSLFEFDLSYIETQPVLTPTIFPLNRFTNYILKRGFDILFSILLIIFIGSWLFPIIALLIKLDSKGPAFFRQKRYGYHNEVFDCYKFRTMVVNDESSIKTTADDDERITKFGRLLRKSSLDEMPQFINVLFGHMSVVGPRPHMLIVDNYYRPRIGRYSLRSMVKPGITGLAQVNGLRGDDENMEIGMQKRVLADSFYVKNWSLSLDLVIILKTIFLVIKGDKKAK